MWPISITETGNHADIDIDHSIFPDTLPPSPPLPRNNIVPWMKKQAGSCVKNPSVQTWITVENEKKSGMISFLGSLDSFITPSEKSFSFLLLFFLFTLLIELSLVTGVGSWTVKWLLSALFHRAFIKTP